MLCLSHITSSYITFNALYRSTMYLQSLKLAHIYAEQKRQYDALVAQRSLAALHQSQYPYASSQIPSQGNLTVFSSPLHPPLIEPPPPPPAKALVTRAFVIVSRFPYFSLLFSVLQVCALTPKTTD